MPDCCIEDFGRLVTTTAQGVVAYGGDVIGTFRHTFTNCGNPDSELCDWSTSVQSGVVMPGTYEVRSRWLHTR